MDLIRRCTDSRGFCLTVPLITKSDGTKFGKTAGGSVYLTQREPALMSSISTGIAPDADVIKFLKYFTFLSKEEINAVEEETKQFPNTAQKKLLLK